MAKRPKSKCEDAEYFTALRRLITGAARRAGKNTACLAELVDLQEHLDRATHRAVAALRAEPVCASWAQIGAELGITRQAALMRFKDAGGARKPGGQPSSLR